jgi:hypothetical protein
MESGWPRDEDCGQSAISEYLQAEITSIEWRFPCEDASGAMPLWANSKQNRSIFHLMAALCGA